MKNGEEVYEIFGQLGHLVEIWPVDDEEKKTVLFQKEDLVVDTISYPPVSLVVFSFNIHSPALKSRWILFACGNLPPMPSSKMTFTPLIK